MELVNSAVPLRDVNQARCRDSLTELLYLFRKSVLFRASLLVPDQSLQEPVNAAVALLE